MLEKAVAECTDLSGEMKSCSVFEFADDAASCTIESMPDDLKDENTEGPMSNLPGGCEIQSGPERATKGKGASGSSSGGKSAGVSSPENKSKDESPAVNKESSSSSPAAESKPEGNVAESKPAGNVAESKPAGNVAESKPEGNVAAEKEDKHDEKVAEYVAPPAPTTTSPPAEAPVADHAGNAIRTEIYTSNGIVYENLVVVKEVTVTEGAKAKRTPEAEHVQRHGHRHEHVKRHAHGGRRLR